MPNRKRKFSEQSDRLQEQFFTIGKVVLLTGVLVAAFAFAAIFTMRWTVRGTVVEVPDLKGLTVQEAEAQLAPLELSIAATGERYDDQVPEGQIMSQEPVAGVDIKAGRTVQVAISAGKRENPVPDVRGNSLRAARFLIEQSGYSVGNVSEVFLEGEQQSRVVSQFPLPGSTDNVSAQIDLLVGREKRQQFIMPEVVGENLNRVLLFFRRHGFEVGRIQYRDRPDLARGTIVRQFPEPGYPIAAFDTVNLEVAR